MENLILTTMYLETKKKQDLFLKFCKDFPEPLDIFVAKKIKGNSIEFCRVK